MGQLLYAEREHVHMHPKYFIKHSFMPLGLTGAILQEPEMVQEMLIDAGPPRPMPQAPLSGWVLATSVLLAARLARTSAEASRFDLDSLQVTTPSSTFLPAASERH